MEVIFSRHARRRMRRYRVSEEKVRDILTKPQSVVSGHQDRKIAQSSLNHYILRVVYVEEEARRIVVTVYPAEKERYQP
ncbi:MAG: DUF4258 domain-containing protein [Euryarchaeota archaeon]|nr:DUF4258 domain-containing protein [Euryarchaeota archaeon]